MSCSVIYSMVCGLLITCQAEDSSDSGLIAKVKETIRAELITRFEPGSIENAKSTPLLAALLDPCCKSLQLLTRDQRKGA